MLIESRREKERKGFKKEKKFYLLRHVISWVQVVASFLTPFVRVNELILNLPSVFYRHL